MARHERFAAWQLAHGLALAVYRESAVWPSSERYGLTIQARRAAVSVAANIAEGAAKRGSKEFRRYLDMALGSLGELSSLLRLAHDLGYLPPEAWERVGARAEEAGKCIMGLYRSLDERRSSI